MFVYAATFVMPHDEMLKILSINSTRTVLYGDRITFGRHAEHPEIPRMWNSTDIFAEQFPEAFRNHHGMDYQQQWVCAGVVCRGREADESGARRMANDVAHRTVPLLRREIMCATRLFGRSLTCTASSTNS